MRLEDTLRDEANARFLVADKLVLDRIDQRAWLDSSRLQLGAKAIALLEELMRNPQVLVSKDRLFHVGWPDQAVSDAVLTTAIREIRRALADPARSPEWIETHHGKGYRFLKQVEERGVHPGRRDEEKAPPEAPEADRKGRLSSMPNWLRWAAVVGILVVAGAAILNWQGHNAQSTTLAEKVETKSVVMLPFRALDDDADAVAAGLNEEISTVLTRTADIHLASAGVTQRVIENGADAEKTALDAGFGYILTGTVRTSGKTIRVTARLTSTHGGEDVWSKSFDRTSDDLIVLQEDVAFGIARALGSVMDPARLREMVSIGTTSVEAYQALREAREMASRAVTTSDTALMDAARERYLRAQREDPSFARAFWEAAQLERMIATSVYADGADPQADAALRESYNRNVDAAIAAAPNDTDRSLYKAARLVSDYNYRGAVRLLEKYLEDRPRDDLIWFSLLEQARKAERYDLVDKALDHITRINLDSGEFPVFGTNYLSHDPDRALRYARDAMKEAPDYTALQFQAHRAFLIAGHNDEARALLARMTQGELPVAVRDGARIRQLCADGKTREAQALARNLLADGTMPLVVRWSSAVTAGLEQEADALLAPFRERDALFTLSQFLIYDEFDASRFPALASGLARSGIKRPPPKLPRYACRPATSTR